MLMSYNCVLGGYSFNNHDISKQDIRRFTWERETVNITVPKRPKNSKLFLLFDNIQPSFNEPFSASSQDIEEHAKL